MLVNFIFNHFKSFKNNVTFSMVPGKTKQHPNHINEQHQLLTFAALYGANASGKSNFVDAIDTFQKIVRGKFTTSHHYCKLVDNGKNKPTFFKIIISLDNKIFIYELELFLYSGEIIREELILFEENSNQYQTLYIVENNQLMLNETVYKNLEDKDKIRFDIYKMDFLIDKEDSTNVPFLYFINKNKKEFNDKLLKNINKVYRWLVHQLRIYRPMASVTQYDKLFMLRDKKKKLTQFLIEFGVDVQKVMSEKIHLSLIDDIPTKVFRSVEKDLSTSEDSLVFLRTAFNIYFFYNKEDKMSAEKLVFKHHHAHESFSLHDESDGTQRLLSLFDVIDNQEEVTYIIDELDRSLHPNLTYKFIKKKLENNHSQLIITTHEDRLLDLNLIRRDEIWFVEKHPYSKLYSLEEFKVRHDKSIVKDYLDGRYGAIPNFKSLLEE